MRNEPSESPAADDVPIPQGTVTFLFTDVEGSTALWAADADAMAASLQQHDELLRSTFEALGGYVFTTAGDSFAVAFSRASDAVRSAVDAQAALASASWDGPALRVRMGIHQGEAVERGGDYFGPVVNLTARLETAGHGGQVLLSAAVEAAVDVTAVSLGTHTLRDVAQPIGIHQLGDHEFPPLRIVAPNRTNLPVAPSRLIGRERDLAAVRKTLLDSRLVTLTAAGGTGKTRLVLAVGEEVLPHRADGVWFVDLSTVSEADRIPAAIASAVGLQLSGGDATEQVVRYLAGLDALIVLDNCEHLVDGCADFLEAFLSRPGDSTMLATTREYFDIDGERAIRLSPLSVDGADSAAVDLFADRALATDVALTLDGDDRSVIAELCGHLDGSPLAIELAASRCNVMSPAELLGAIGDRFELLKGGRRRHSRQALEDTLDWSYELLDDDERSLFSTLGVFAGSFDLQAVVTVGAVNQADAVDLMHSLTAKSLVVSERIDGATRFRLLETPAAYAERRLDEVGETTAVRHRHLDHYLERSAPFGIGWMPTTRSHALAADRSNILAATEWAATSGRWSDATQSLFCAYELLSSQADVVFGLARRCAEHGNVLDDLGRERANGAALGSAVQLDDFAAAGQLVGENVESADPVRQAYGHGGMAWFTLSLGMPAEALEILVAAERELLEIPDGVRRLQALARLKLTEGWAHAHLGRWHEAIGAYGESLEWAGQLAMPTMDYGMVLHALALANLELGDVNAALDLALMLDGDESVYAHADDVRIVAHIADADFDRALPFLRAHAADAVTGRLSRAANDALLFMALLAEANDDHPAAVRLLMGVEQTRTVPTIATSISLADRLGVREEFDVARTRGREDRVASGRRSIDQLRTELAEATWAS